MAAQICEYAKIHWIVHFKWTKYTSKKAVIKSKNVIMACITINIYFFVESLYWNKIFSGE
jgi:hypothetical protein